MKIDRQKVLDKYDGHCAYCGKQITLKTMQIDHIVPKYSFGTGDKSKIPSYYVDDYENLNPSCRSCNFYKGTNSIDDFRNSIITLHDRILKQFINRMGIDYGIIQLKEWDRKFYFEKLEANNVSN